MSRADFEVAYDGEALHSHTMDVDQLAPALLALGELCREANRLLNGQKAGVSVRVKADFEHKCFDIHLELVQSLYSQIRDLVSEDHVVTAKTILEWLGLIGAPSVVGLLGYRKIQKGRKVAGETRIVAGDGSVSYNIVFEGDGNTVTIPSSVRDLANDPQISRAEKAIVRPLQANGIEKLEIRENGVPFNTINKSEIDFFGQADIQQDGPEEEPATITAILELRGPVFVAGEKWQFHFGDEKIWAEISDKQFLVRVFAYGERFGVGDKLKVDLKLTQYQTRGGSIRNSYEVIKVYEVWTAKEQSSLPLDPSA